MFNHGVSSSLGGMVKVVLVNPQHGKVHHYRDVVMKGWERNITAARLEEGIALVEDKSIRKVEETVRKEMTSVFEI